MSRSIRICSYLLLPLIYLLVNVKIAQLGESFPITIVTFLPVLLFLFIAHINLKQFFIVLGIGVGLILYNYVFGQVWNSGKYLTSTLLFVYTILTIALVSAGRFKKISAHNHRKVLRAFLLMVIIAVAIAALEMIEIILTGKSTLIERISSILIYSNSYIVKFIHFGGMRTTSLYYEPAFFSLALLSMWLCIKQFAVRTRVADLLVLGGVSLSGSFSGVMVVIVFLFVDWMLKYCTKKNVRKKLPLAMISLVIFIVGVAFAFPYLSERFEDLGVVGSSSYYRIIGPLIMVQHALTEINGIVRFGSLYDYVRSFGILNGDSVGKTVDNGIYLLVIYFSWFGIVIAGCFLLKLCGIFFSQFGKNYGYYTQLYLFVPLSLLFTGSIFSPEYIFLVVCPFILRKAINHSEFQEAL
ncbi:putative colanic acid polymerase WcaD [Scandinavium sp. M-37]|jgi:putative colanic acid polymerase|uniref:putative colanic acid polymerase WcaD n=1 Tax=Scandinavium sp. M-37 TaxID=3373077 RepID=UPI0037464D8A